MTPEAFEAVFNLPFKEAEGFFQEKLSIPTSKWDDLWKGEHAKGFMSAGAQKAELLSDLRDEVAKGIAGKLTVKEFREKFDGLVAKHGWAYRGGRNWRSDLIYDTNVTTAYQAGRWQQFREGGARFLKYVHADGVRHPRPLHVSWNGTVLPIEDPFWGSHYPPNGWRCHCRAVRAEAAEERQPPAGWRELDPKSGTMKGVDKGWDYNVGAAAGRDFRVLSDKFEALPNDISRAWMKEHVAGPAFARFVEGKIEGEFPVAVLKSEDMEALGSLSQTVWMSQETLLAHLKRHPDVGLEDYRKLPQIIDEGEVYRQGEERLIFLKAEEKVYRAVAKRTNDGTANFLITLFETTAGKALREVTQKYERIR